MAKILFFNNNTIETLENVTDNIWMKTVDA